MAHGLTLTAVALAVLALASDVAAHGGGLHAWNFWPEPTPGKEFIRYMAASCSSWTRVNVNNYVLGALPAFPPAPAAIEATGMASVWYYLDGNCTDRATTTFDINLNVTLNGVPYGNRQVNGYGFTGACSAPGDFYRHNASRGDDRFNLMWWRREASLTTAEGALIGAAPNTFISRAPPASDALRSIVLFPSPADSDPVCCDLVYAPPPPSDFLTQGSFCRVPAPPPPSPPTPPPAPAPPASPLPSPSPSPSPVPTPSASPKPSPKPSPRPSPKKKPAPKRSPPRKAGHW